MCLSFSIKFEYKFEVHLYCFAIKLTRTFIINLIVMIKTLLGNNGDNKISIGWAQAIILEASWSISKDDRVLIIVQIQILKYAIKMYLGFFLQTMMGMNYCFSRLFHTICHRNMSLHELFIIYLSYIYYIIYLTYLEECKNGIYNDRLHCRATSASRG